MKRNIISIMQPTYLPWMGYFAMIDASDCFVIYDDVQFSKQSWQSRNRIIFKDNRTEWLSVPIVNSGLDKLINETKYQNNGWIRKHLTKIHHIYSRTAYYDEVYNLLEEILSYEHESLASLNTSLITSICDYLGITTRIINSSSLFHNYQEKNEKLIEIVKSVNGEVYYSPPGAMHYINTSIFINNDIEVVSFEYNHPVYKQWNDEFISHLSVIDLLFRYGQNSLEIIRSGWSR